MAREMKDSGVQWICKIPSHWEVKSLQSMFTFGKGLSITKDDLVSDGFPVVSYGQIHSKSNPGTKLIPELVRYVKNDFVQTNGSSLVMKGGFIFADTSEDVDGCGNSVYIDGDFRVFAGYHTIILQPRESTENKYYAYLFKSDIWRKQIREQVMGVKLFSISQKILKAASILVPPISEQNQIAQMLDLKCDQIDISVEKIQASIEEYKAFKQAVIVETVTKGIRGDRPMKDSGIDWIGQIPYDWRVQRIKTIFSLRDERNYLPLEEVNLISLYTDKGVVQHSDLETTTGNKASNADGYKLVYKGDIVVNIILCWMGAIGFSAYEGVTSPAYDVYIPSSAIDSRFYHHYFRTVGFSGDCYKRGKGIMAMRWRTYSDQFRDIKVVVPPLAEQKEIVAYLDMKCAQIDELIAEKEKILYEIENYKKSLIYEYVTGKKEA